MPAPDDMESAQSIDGTPSAPYHCTQLSPDMEMRLHMDATPAFDPEFLDVLRCPVAVQDRSLGNDPGRLELVKGCWLVSADSGYKYPIRDGIPILLIEEGAKWKDTPTDDLPVPPPKG
jgi:uncharacterized protein YbaR (Trm112 family)